MRRLPAEIGEQTDTLFHVREIGAYNDWVFSYLKPLLGRRVLEVGCGIGTYTTRMARVAERIVALDPVASYAATVRNGCRGVAAVVGALPADAGFRPASFDTAVCLNVIEHVAEPLAALAAIRSWLVTGGVVFVQVPAHAFLFGSIDEVLGHHRRYTAASLASLLEEAGFEPALRPRFLYALAMPGWWMVGRVLRRRTVPAGGVRAADRMARVSRAIEDRLRLPFGLSLVAAGRVPA